MSDKKIAVLYHAKCLDGLGAAYAAWTAFGDTADYVPMTYNMDPELWRYKDKYVYLVDFSFKREVFLELKSLALSVTVLDHHKTAHEEIGDLVKIDQTKSGAILAWEFFRPNEKPPVFLEYIQDRDLWTWKMDHTAEISAFLYCTELDLPSFIKAIDTPIREMISMGSILIKQQAFEVEQAYKTKRDIKLLGFTVPCCNAHSSVISLVGNKMAQGKPFSLSYSDSRDKRYFSLRSTKEGEDVSLIAKRFGGGGHFSAAGFSLMLDSPLLSNFMYEIKDPD